MNRDVGVYIFLYTLHYFFYFLLFKNCQTQDLLGQLTPTSYFTKKTPWLFYIQPELEQKCLHKPLNAFLLLTDTEIIWSNTGFSTVNQ